ncbi:hypothetical protein TrLO_g14571 [Triparma laevis f. longispina]|uniref:Uncharacterized protein n=1 Tax=Triparma laevis f. longispina TaxID=1714387 RepID=A0A9W7C3K4_9STRA|nr:hypothetical protein TrLO_g14571 [Triparma laevis f. longispina]
MTLKVTTCSEGNETVTLVKEKDGVRVGATVAPWANSHEKNTSEEQKLSAQLQSSPLPSQSASAWSLPSADAPAAPKADTPAVIVSSNPTSPNTKPTRWTDDQLSSSSDSEDDDDDGRSRSPSSPEIQMSPLSTASSQPPHPSQRSPQPRKLWSPRISSPRSPGSPVQSRRSPRSKKTWTPPSSPLPSPHSPPTPEVRALSLTEVEGPRSSSKNRKIYDYLTGRGRGREGRGSKRNDNNTGGRSRGGRGGGAAGRGRGAGGRRGGGRGDNNGGNNSIAKERNDNENEREKNENRRRPRKPKQKPSS